MPSVLGIRSMIAPPVSFIDLTTVLTDWRAGLLHCPATLKIFLRSAELHPPVNDHHRWPFSSAAKHIARMFELLQEHCVFLLALTLNQTTAKLPTVREQPKRGWPPHTLLASLFVKLTPLRFEL